MAEPCEVLDRARRDAGLSHGELWIRYFELGGMRTALELEAILYGGLTPSARDHDVIAHAINERFVELGANRPVPYALDGNDASLQTPHQFHAPSRRPSAGR